MTFGEYIREHREALKSQDRRFSVRQVAQRIGVEPAYLSKIERGDVAPPSEAKIQALAEELGMAGHSRLRLYPTLKFRLSERPLKTSKLLYASCRYQRHE